jgi:hypothetical protein
MVAVETASCEAADRDDLAGWRRCWCGSDAGALAEALHARLVEGEPAAGLASLSAVAAAELAEDPADVCLRGQPADHESGRDLFVRETGSDET